MTQHILALETSGIRCGVAVLCAAGDGRTDLFAAHHDGAQTHAEHMLPLVSSVLARAGVSRTDLDAVAFGAGPGGFTGLRVACGVAQGIALALDLPVLAVGTHDAVADSLSRDGATSVVAVAMDARMGEVYAALFVLPAGSAQPSGPGVPDIDMSQPAPYRLSGPVLLSAADLAPWLREARARALAHLRTAGQDGEAVRWVLAGDAWSLPGMAVPDAWRRDPLALSPGAGAVARLGGLALARGEGQDPAQAQPIYVRDKVAFTTAERAGGLGGNPKAAPPDAGDRA